jgi:hypothetical protein
MNDPKIGPEGPRLRGLVHDPSYFIHSKVVTPAGFDHTTHNCASGDNAAMASSLIDVHVMRRFKLISQLEFASGTQVFVQFRYS